MTEIILKGENHHSDADFEEEKELIKDKPDALLIEGKRRNNEINLSNFLFMLPTKIVLWIIGRVQTPHNLLLDLADFQDIEIYYTRESNEDLKNNAPAFIKTIAFLGSVAFFLLFVYSGLGYIKNFGTIKRVSSFICFLAFPLLIFRGYNTFISKSNRNRDKIMVQKIHKLVDEGYDKILVILGDKHLKGVKKHLRENLNVNLIPPKDNWYSLANLKGLLVPVIEICLISYSLYLIVIKVFESLIHYLTLILQL